MTEKPKFCGSCGARLPEGALFCGDCGWRIAASDPPPPKSADPEKLRVPEPRIAEHAAPPPETRTPVAEPAAERVRTHQGASPDAPLETARRATIGEVLSSAILWGATWLVGWVPLGLFMGFFWEEKRYRYGEFVDRFGYDPGWGYTLPGATTGFALGGVLGGIVAGVILGKAMPRALSGAGKRALVVVLVWLAGWAVAIGGPAMRFVSGDLVTDDELLLIAFGATLVIAVLAAQVAMRVRDAAPSLVSRLVVTFGWLGAAIMAIFLVAGFIDL